MNPDASADIAAGGTDVWQIVVVAAIVAVAMIYLVRMFLRTKKTGGCAGCGKGAACCCGTDVLPHEKATGAGDGRYPGSGRPGAEVP